MSIVILLRHGEKHDWQKGLEPSLTSIQAYEDNHLLSSKGMERAHALVGYFLHRPEITTLLKQAPLAGLVAQDVDDQGWGKSHRPRHTLEPLARALGHDIKAFPKRSLNEAVDYVNTFKTKTVIVCWSHQQLPDFVQALGYPISKWPKHRYDVTWVLFKDEHRLEQWPQCLLYGDKTEI